MFAVLCERSTQEARNCFARKAFTARDAYQLMRDASHASQDKRRFQLRPVMRAKHHASVGTHHGAINFRKLGSGHLIYKGQGI